MKWILCGKNNAAVDCLEFLTSQGDEVWAIATKSDDGRDSWQHSFKAAALRLGVSIDQPRRINDPEFVERLAAFGATALISIQYDQILHGGLFRRIGCPCLNLHFARLPRHRGVAPIAWAILEGDAEAGVTLHHMVEEIDAGDTLAQRSVPIGPADTARELYDRVAEAAVALFKHSYPFSPDLLSARLPQDPGIACYHRKGDLDFSIRQIDWKQPAASLHAWLRAMIFPPMQYPEASLKGRRFRVERVAGSLGGPVTAPPGVVVASSAAGIDVAAADRALRITELTDAARPQVTSAEIKESIAVGEQFV